jgi:GntR family transcriptional regulator, transcriptional repressor for pyruvate dehydrogenase complex
MDFHSTIAKFAENSILAQIIDSLIDLYSFEQLAIMSFYDDRLGDHAEHRQILEAIRAKEATRARNLMYQHLLGVRTVVEAKLVGADQGAEVRE